jgi:hypothetical protein
MFQSIPIDSSVDSLDSKQKRRLFTPEEDALLCRVMLEQQFVGWNAVAARIPGRTARQCRDRWANYVCPENKNAPWTDLEDDLLIAKFRELGPRWTSISKFFDGRSENNVKNRWYTHVRQKAENMAAQKKEKPVRKERFPSIASLNPSLMIRPIFSLDNHPQTIAASEIHPSSQCFI